LQCCGSLLAHEAKSRAPHHTKHMIWHQYAPHPDMTPPHPCAAAPPDHEMSRSARSRSNKA
jgi:hypothetical protein